MEFVITPAKSLLNEPIEMSYSTERKLSTTENTFYKDFNYTNILASNLKYTSEYGTTALSFIQQLEKL